MAHTEAAAATQPYFTFDELTDDQLSAAFRLRYAVYHEELGFFDKDPIEGPAGPEERDEYDPHSVHVGAIYQTGEVVGSARLVHPRPLGLPLEEHCSFDDDFWRPYGANRPQDILHRPGMAEICRLVVSADFRRRADDGRYALSAAASGGATDERRESRPVIALGLFKACYQASLRHGISHWLMAVEPSLVAALQRYAIPFEQIGPIVEYHGPVAPYMASLATLEERMRRSEPALFAEWSVPD